MQNSRPNEHILLLNNLNNKTQRQKINKSIKLGSMNRQKKHISTPASKVTLANSQQILSSVSRKLQPENISTLSRNYANQTSFERQQVQITCMVDFDSVSLMSFISDRIQITFQELLKKAKKENKLQVIVDVHENKKDRKGCFEQNCNIKKKWMKNIVFYERELKNLMILKEKLPFIKKNVLEQINKDVTRSFPENMFPKKKLTIYHAASEKVCMLETLKIVLKLYSIFDEQISYVQGINLVAASIVTHMKQIQPSFIFLKQLMNYGKLRNFYLNDFDTLKKQSVVFYQNYLKNTIYELYDHFMQHNVESLIIVPCYYTCLFSSIIDINYMHIVIDQFFMQGVAYLHKLYLSLLLYLKEDLLEAGEETLVRLGSTYLKNLSIPWGEIILVCEQLRDF